MDFLERALSLQSVHWIVWVYVLMVLVTAGYFYRHGRREPQRRFFQSVAALAWPVSWLLAYGVVGTSEILVKAFTAIVGLIFAAIEAVITGFFQCVKLIFLNLEQPVIAIWSIGMIFFPAYYLATQWASCSATLCADIIVKALLWSPFWPMYIWLYFL